MRPPKYPSAPLSIWESDLEADTQGMLPAHDAEGMKMTQNVPFFNKFITNTVVKFLIDLLSHLS